MSQLMELIIPRKRRLEDGLLIDDKIRTSTDLEVIQGHAHDGQTLGRVAVHVVGGEAGGWGLVVEGFVHEVILFFVVDVRTVVGLSRGGRGGGRGGGLRLGVSLGVLHCTLRPTLIKGDLF